VSVTANRFRLNPVVELHWVGWHDEYVVFDETSGQTHLLDSLRAFLLNALSEREHDVESLLFELEHAAEMENNRSLRDTVNSILAEFDTVGLLKASVECS
jgi:PqqD family protein of HPr-rel-A system